MGRRAWGGGARTIGVEEFSGSDSGGFCGGIKVVEQGGKLFDSVPSGCFIDFYLTHINSQDTQKRAGRGSRGLAELREVISWSRVVSPPPTEGWAVLSVMSSCCHRYAVDFVFSRYEGRGSSRKGVDAIVAQPQSIHAWRLRIVLNGASASLSRGA